MSRRGVAGPTPQKSTTSTFWEDDPELIPRLKQLWDAGVVVEEIGRRLGCTKNAALGKAHRLGFEPRIKEPETERRPHAYEAVGANSCRFPIGHPKDDDFHFCCSRIEEGKRWPYCREHQKTVKSKSNKVDEDE